MKFKSSQNDLLRQSSVNKIFVFYNYTTSNNIYIHLKKFNVRFHTSPYTSECVHVYEKYQSINDYEERETIYGSHGRIIG